MSKLINVTKATCDKLNRFKNNIDNLPDTSENILLKAVVGNPSILVNNDPLSKAISSVTEDLLDSHTDNTIDKVSKNK